MSKPHKIYGKVEAAKYIEHARSFVIIVRDLESKKLLKPMEVTPVKFGVSPDLDVSSYDFFASKLKERMNPITIEFQGDREYEDSVMNAMKEIESGLDSSIQHEITESGEALVELHERIKNDDSFILKQLRERGF